MNNFTEMMCVCKLTVPPFGVYSYDSFSNLLISEILDRDLSPILYNLLDYFNQPITTIYGTVKNSELFRTKFVTGKANDIELEREIELEMIYRTLKKLREEIVWEEIPYARGGENNPIVIGNCHFYCVPCSDGTLYEEDYESNL